MSSWRAMMPFPLFRAYSLRGAPEEARMKTVVVTGVSTGIGRAAAEVLLNKGFRVFGSLRNEADAARLKSALGAHFTPLLFDITDPAAVAEAADEVKAALGGKTLYGLVNNAGIAVPGP